MAGPTLPNLEPFYAAGINPKTGLPMKFSGPCTLKEDIKKQLRLVDEQDAVNRYVWYNLPMNLPSQENLIKKYIITQMNGDGLLYIK